MTMKQLERTYEESSLNITQFTMKKALELGGEIAFRYYEACYIECDSCKPWIFKQMSEEYSNCVYEKANYCLEQVISKFGNGIKKPQSDGWNDNGFCEGRM